MSAIRTADADRPAQLGEQELRLALASGQIADVPDATDVHFGDVRPPRRPDKGRRRLDLGKGLTLLAVQIRANERYRRLGTYVRPAADAVHMDHTDYLAFRSRTPGPARFVAF